MQAEYNLIYHEEEREALPYWAADGIGVLAWSPLARGFLAGERNAGRG
jgi:1-deoxyxylulose-5-phosphate synthase